MIDRRTFIQQAGVVTAAIMLNPSMSCGKSEQNADNKIGIQLYSLREQLPKDVAGTIDKVARAGYQEVEVYGFGEEGKFWSMSPKALRELLDAHSLDAPSGHYLLDTYLAGNGDTAQLELAAEAAIALGHRYITIPFLAEELRKTADDYKRLAEKFNKAGEYCRQANLKLGYHNHAFEFDQLGDTSGLEIFLQHTDPDLVDFELDIYWVARAGRDSVTLFKQYPERFSMWHVKDMDKADPQLNTEVGRGSIDYQEIFAAAKVAGLKHLFVEQENFAIDPFRSIAQSASYIKKTLLPAMS